MALFNFPPGQIRSPRPTRRGFTLVELLVVIGIIALLISILLPSLAAARRQAMALKCEAALREIGNAALMYAGENRQYFPPAKVIAPSGNPYEIDGIKYPSTTGLAPYVNGSNGVQAYWLTFLAKYVTKNKMMGAGTGQDTDLQKRTVLWGCPAWDGYNGGTNTIQPGLGWNAWPSYTVSYPPLFQLLSNVSSNDVFVITWPPPGNGTWYKQGKFTHPSERLLCADSLFWLIESENQSTVGANGAIPGQNASYNTATYTAPGQTLYDFYRHGIYPASNGSTLNTSGGKVSFNILYADGHVSNVNDRKEGYRALRQRFPG